MLAHSDGGTFEGVAIDGIRRVWGYMPLHRSASGVLFVRVGMPVDAAYAEANGAFYRNLLLIAAAALLIMGIAWAGGERLVIRPVKRLTAAARHLSEGNLGARTGLPHGDSEFGQLARVFDGMAYSIQSEEATGTIDVVDALVPSLRCRAAVVSLLTGRMTSRSPNTHATTSISSAVTATRIRLR